MDTTNSLGLDGTVPDRDGHSKDGVKLLNPTKEHYGEVIALVDWLNRSFYKGDLAMPMVTFRTAQKCLSVYVPEKWDHRTGTSRPEFRLNPLLLKQASFEIQCMELLRLMEHLRQAKASRTNYHDRDYALGMKEHGLQTHREGATEKETGERITISVVPGGKFERLVARKLESGFSFSWAIRDSEPSKDGEAGSAEGVKAGSKSGRKFKYHCPAPGCATAFWGKDGQKGGCFEHDPPVLLEQVD